MTWIQQVYFMIGLPIGISLSDGTGTSGILCNVENEIVYLLEYMYRDQFALKKYPFHMIQDIHQFPSCNGNSRIPPIPDNRFFPPRFY